MDREQRISFLLEQCGALGLHPDERQTAQFMDYYEYLIHINEVMNLTAVTEYEEVVIKHFADSLSLVKVLPHPEAYDTYLDLGTGAGFPGVPLKIMFPDIRLVLADSLNKRIRFLNEVIAICGFENVSTVHGRAEELARKKEYREQFDICVSRAVANLSSLSEYCLPFVKEGGKFISYKAGNVEEELGKAKRAITLLGGAVRQSPVSFMLPGTDISRTLIPIDKIRETPAKYPRKPGTPLREPL